MAAYYVSNSDPDDDKYPAVIRVPPRCPRCRSDRQRITGQGREGGVRYHRCMACGQKFKSNEPDPPEVVGEKN